MVWLRLTLILNHPEQEDRMYDNMVVVLENSHRLRTPQKYFQSPSHPCQKTQWTCVEENLLTARH